MLRMVFVIVFVFSVAMIGIAKLVRPALADHFDNVSNLSRVEAVGVYSITSVAAIAFAVPVAGLVMAAAGFLFGHFYGTLLAVVCLVTGSFFTFLFTRKYLRRKVFNKYDSEISKVNAGMGRHGLKYLLFLRISPFPPVSVTNFAMGVTTISALNFLWVSLVGMIPAAAFYAYIGSQLASMAKF